MSQDHITMRETLQHKTRVGDLMTQAAMDIMERAVHHDDSKFSEEEFPSFVKATPLLKGTTYGSEEYKFGQHMIATAIGHHYRRNRHHPEHHSAGISSMTLIDLVEMLCDWKAASERHDDGCIVQSIKINIERFGISNQLAQILYNTAREVFGVKVPDTAEAV